MISEYFLFISFTCSRGGASETNLCLKGYDSLQVFDTTDSQTIVALYFMGSLSFSASLILFPLQNVYF